MTSPLDTEKSATLTVNREPLVTSKNENFSRRSNPIWKYMGFGENFQPRLPSRNWIVFFSIIGTIGAAVIYDKREKKRKQVKWCKLVQHIAKQPLDSRSMPRKISVYLEAPPMDGLRVAQDHFNEYVKPILVSSGLDWEFVQGRKEGDIRAKVADSIRKLRLPAEFRVEEDDVARFRMKNGIKDFEGPGGDIVIGRHTWKEYIRGLHEGWLGPLTEPSKTEVKDPNEQQKINLSITSPETPQSELDRKSSPSDTKAIENVKELKVRSPYIDTSHYLEASLSTDIPNEFQPSIPISFPHVIGFFNTPKRIHRFFNRRKLADQIGRETAAVILSNYRPYRNFAEQSLPNFLTESQNTQNDDIQSSTSSISELHTALQNEEKEWHKSTWHRLDDESERTWLCPIVLDPRIISRMRRFELSSEEEERAKNIVVHEEEIEGWIKGNIRRLWKTGKAYYQTKKIFNQ